MNNLGSKRKLRKPLIAVFLLLLMGGTGIFLQSCTKEHFNFDKLKDPVWNPTFAVPLVHTTLSVRDILDRTDEDSVIVIDPGTQLLALIYTSEIFSLEAQEFLNIPDLTSGGPFSLTAPQAAQVAGGTPVTIAPGAQTEDFSPLFSNGESLTEIDYKNGILRMTIDGNINADGALRLQIPDLVQGGVGFDQTCNFTANPNNVTCDFPLAGYTLDMNANPNQFTFIPEITFSSGTPTPAQSNNISFSFLNQEFSAVRGDIGQQVFATGRDSVKLGIFDNTTDGQIFYEDPRFYMTFTSSIGADVEVTASQFDGVNNGNSVTIPSALPYVRVIGGPIVEGDSVITTYSFDNTNSNIVQATNISPLFVVYDVSSMTNPGGTGNNFVLDTSRIKLDGTIELPFHGRAQDFTKMTDTIDFDPDSLEYGFSDSSAISGEIVAVTMRLTINNGFPAEGMGQVYFMKANGTVVDSLIPNPADMLFQSGQINGSGDVTAPTLTTRDIVLSAEQLEFLKQQDVEKLVARGTVETTNGGQDVIKIYEYYTMDLDLGMKIEFEATADLDSLRSGN